MSQCIVSTPGGKVRGTEEKNIRLFRGIPYAQTERFTAPKMISRWEGILDATGPETDCFQYGTFRDESREEGNFYYREFCTERDTRYGESPMTLSIVAPSEGENCPVLLFIHGGGFETGTVNDLPYGQCTEYAERGIVFVSVGYRLNIFSLYETNNFGLQDQMTAILWVKDNIAAFGGDPDRITIIGQSAGAMSIADLCYTRQLQGVVSGAVMMSGCGKIPKFAGPWRKEKNADFWAAIRKRAGAENEEQMKTLPPQTIWEAWYQESRERNDLHLLQPGIDGTIIPDDPVNIPPEAMLDVPMIVGVTSQDFMPQIIYELARRWGIESANHNKQPVYGYLFDRNVPGDGYKAWHGADLWYLFGNMDRSWRPFEDTDRALSRQTIDYIANFTRTGDPNGGGLPQWRPVTRRQQGFRLFDGSSEGLIYPAGCRKKLLKTALFEKGPM